MSKEETQTSNQDYGDLDMDFKYEILPENIAEYDLSFKIILIGDENVGKSCLTIKAAKNLFKEFSIPTIGLDYFSFKVKIDEKMIRLQIWDTCGQEVYGSLTGNFYNDSSLAMIVYSIDSKKSFENIEIWLKELRNRVDLDTKVFLIGNKNDLESKRVIRREEGESYAKSNNYNLFAETSAKTGFNSKKIFVKAAKMLYDEHINNMAEIKFNFKGIDTTIKCNTYDKMKDIINKYSLELGKKVRNCLYSYNGTKIDEELTFNGQANDSDKDRKKMDIIISKTEEDEKENENEINTAKSGDVICPECKENAFLEIHNFKINLFGCKNNHNINNILLEEYEKTQKIDLSKIICDICKENNKNNDPNNEFFVCNTCNINICPLCIPLHDKEDEEHIIINYDDKNFVCKIHSDSFIKYCKTCNENICIACENNHKDHNSLDLGDILIDKDDLLKTQENLKNIIDEFQYKINIMKEILDRAINLSNLYYKINSDIINNYQMNKINYQTLQIINNLKNENEKIIKDLSNIINTDKIFQIYEFPNNKYKNNNGEIYIGEIENGLKNGKGILYYNKNDEFKRKKYEGEFKNDMKEGIGIMYYNNGDRYEGGWKEDKREGKRIMRYDEGKKEEGNWKNNEYLGN